VTDILERLAPLPLIAILRAPDASMFRKATEVVYESGIRCVEFTLTSDSAIDATRDVVATMPGDLQVDQAIDAGAAFLVSQVLRPRLIEVAERRGTPFIPGALTPTEILAAWECGIPAVKVSPIGPVGGLDYFHNVRGPLPDIPLVPTGSVRPDEVRAYLDHGAAAVGLSGHLFGDSLLPGGDLEGLALRTKQAIAAVGPH
jgi:2-dehydro-3-deoxyphosphogluconate aldolase / (4S)-4-hydroxy-2-oxoglutarate aldolase